MARNKKPPTDGKLILKLPKSEPREIALPSGQKAIVSPISLGFVEHIFSAVEGIDDDGSTFSRLAIETMLRENSKKELKDFLPEDREFLILNAVEAWGCQAEFDELSDVHPIEIRFQKAANLQLRRMAETMLASLQATRDMIAETFSAISLAQYSQIETISASISKMAQSFIVPVPDFSKVTEPILRMFQSYSTTFESLYTPDYLKAFSPALPNFAQVEMHNALVVENHFQGIESDETIVQAVGVDKVETLLADLNPELIQLYQGAKTATYSENPDKARHFTSSHRELDTHVLHLLAPDEAVTAWTNNEEHFHNGRPTRRARLLYIVRNAPTSVGSMDFFIQDSLAQLDFLNRDQHRLRHEYSDEFLEILHGRYSGWLQTILSIASGRAFRN